MSEEYLENRNQAERRMHRINLLWPLILIIAVTIFTFSGNSSSTVVTQIYEGQLGIANLADEILIEISDIESVDLLDTLELGRPVSDKVESARYRNDLFGEYELYAQKEVGPYMVIRMDSGEIVVVELNNEKNTKRLYNDLIDALPETE